MTTKIHNIVDATGKTIGYTKPGTFDNLMIFLLQDDGSERFVCETHNFNYFCASYGFKYTLEPYSDTPKAKDDSWMTFAAALNLVKSSIERGISNQTLHNEADCLQAVALVLRTFDLQDQYRALQFSYQVMSYSPNTILDFLLHFSYSIEVDAAFVHKCMEYSDVSYVRADVERKTMMVTWESIL